MTQTITRVNGSLAKTGTLYAPNANAYLITVKTGATAIDLQLEDSFIDSTTQQPNGLYETIIKEINPLIYYAPAAATGLIHVIMDKSINDATELQTRIRRIGGTDILGTTNNTTLTTSAALAVMVGSTVTGPGIPAGTTVSSFATGSLTLSAAVTTAFSTATVFTITLDLSTTTVAAASTIQIA